MKHLSWMRFMPERRFLLAVMAMAFVVMQASKPVQAALRPGDDAPQFSMTDAAGQMVELSRLKGKTVVLEWTNHQCPYVRKHYETHNMQALQKQATEDGVVWISVISSAPGKQGFVDAETALKLSAERNAYPSHVLLDSTGELGMKYDARTTPHMFVIDKDGKLAYMGAIDDQPTARGGVDGARNYVQAALASLKQGEKPDPALTPPYGCSIKY